MECRSSRDLAGGQQAALCGVLGGVPRGPPRASLRQVQRGHACAVSGVFRRHAAGAVRHLSVSRAIALSDVSDLSRAELDILRPHRPGAAAPGHPRIHCGFRLRARAPVENPGGIPSRPRFRGHVDARGRRNPARGFSDLPEIDICFTTEFFEHVHDPLPYFERFHGKLARGGLLVTGVMDHHAGFLHVSPQLHMLRHEIQTRGYAELVPNRIFRKDKGDPVAA
jgi:hypothetical protein